jgi:hypothetical protein
LDEGEAVADGALVADEKQAAGSVGVGVELVALRIFVRYASYFENDT